MVVRSGDCDDGGGLGRWQPKLATAPSPAVAASSVPDAVSVPDRHRLTDSSQRARFRFSQLSHVANAMMKTHSNSRTQLAVLIIRDGLVASVHPGDDTDTGR
jgi:hypothetical protein